MPQIGWFELIIIVLVAVLVIGPKEFPIVMRKVGNFLVQLRDILMMFKILSTKLQA